jgi:hypothetical protein
MPIIPRLGRLTQKDLEFEAGLVVRLTQKKKIVIEPPL